MPEFNFDLWDSCPLMVFMHVYCIMLFPDPTKPPEPNDYTQPEDKDRLLKNLERYDSQIKSAIKNREDLYYISLAKLISNLPEEWIRTHPRQNFLMNEMTPSFFKSLLQLDEKKWISLLRNSISVGYKLV